MLNLDEILNKVTDPEVTEEALQQYLQQLNTEFTAVNVSLKVAEENLLKIVPETHALHTKVKDIIGAENLEISQAKTADLLKSLDMELNKMKDELNTVFNAENTNVDSEDIMLYNSLLAIMSNQNSTDKDIDLAIQSIQTALTSNRSALAVQQNCLTQALANIDESVAENIKLLLNGEDKGKDEVEKELSDATSSIEKQITENIAAYRDFQKKLNPTQQGKEE